MTSKKIQIPLEDFGTPGKTQIWELIIDLSCFPFIDKQILFNYVKNYLYHTVIDWWNNQGLSVSEIVDDLKNRRVAIENEYGKYLDRLKPHLSNSIQDDSDYYYGKYLRYKAGCIITHNLSPVASRAKSPRIMPCYKNDTCGYN